MNFTYLSQILLHVDAHLLGIVNWFLSLPVFQVLSKITYSVYLVHVSIIIGHLGYQRSLFIFNDYTIVSI